MNKEQKTDTIAAIATAEGMAPIAIIRISGCKSVEIVNKIFSKDISKFESHSVNFGEILDKENNLIDQVLITPTQITLVDDVLTQGRTSYACYQRLREVFPDIEIRVFAIVKSQSFSRVEDIFQPQSGYINYNPNTGKTQPLSRS